MADAFGRAGQVTIGAGNAPVEIVGINKFLRDLSRANQSFDEEARIAAGKVAQNLLNKAQAEAQTVTRNRQAVEVMKGMKVGKDRIPKLYLASKSSFVSKSFPNRRRGKRGGKKVTRGDVFFGAEFGGGKFGASNSTTAGAKNRTKTDGMRVGGGHTTQFLRWRKQSGYFFWPTVRKEKENIAREYLDAIQDVLNKLKDNA